MGQAGPEIADDESMRAAQEELRRLDQAESFVAPEAPPLAPGYAPPMQRSRGYSSGGVSRPEGDPGLPMEPLPTVNLAEPKVLEDLYALYPVGDGTYKIRVERKQPTTYHDPRGGPPTRIDGFLADLDEPIQMAEFANRFGGQRYTVSVIGPPSRTIKTDAMGNSVVRRLKSVEVFVPGLPKLTYLPSMLVEDEMTAGMGMPHMRGQQYPMGQNPEVEKARIEAETKIREQDLAERRSLRSEAATAAAEAGKTPERFLDAMSAAADRSVTEIKTLAQQQVELLRSQNTQLREDYQKVREENEKLRVESLNVQQIAERKARESETEKVTALRADHEREQRRVAEEHAKTLEKLAAQHRDDMTRITNSHTEEMRRLDQSSSKERETLARDSERRESQLQKDYDRERESMRFTSESRITQLKETYDARIRDLSMTHDRELLGMKDSKEREILSLKDSRDREVAAIRSQYEMQTSVARDTATLRIENVNNETTRLRDEVARNQARADTAEHELQALRTKQHKEPEEAIEGATKLAALIGWGPKPEGGGEEETGDWKKTLARAGLGLVDKLPEIAKDVLTARGQAQQEQHPQQPPPGFYGYPPPGYGGPPPRQFQQPPPQQPPPQQRRQWGEGFPSQAQPTYQPVYGQPGPSYQGQPSWQQTPGQAPSMYAPPPPPEQGHSRAPAPVPMQQPMQYPEPQPMPMPGYQPPPQQQPQANGPPQQAAMFPSQQPVQQAPQQAPGPQVTATPSGSVHVQASPGGPSVEITQADIGEFMGELEQAIRSGIIPPGMFARALIERVGADKARVVMQVITPQNIVQAITSEPGGEATYIVTRAGQQYVHELWAEAAQILGL